MITWAKAEHPEQLPSVIKLCKQSKQGRIRNAFIGSRKYLILFIMKNLILFFGLFVFSSQAFSTTVCDYDNSQTELSIESLAGDPIKIKLYGKGGIVSVGEKNTVCPERAAEVCANVEILTPKEDDGTVSGDKGNLTLGKKTYKIRNITSSNTLLESANSGHTSGSNFSFIFKNR